MTGPCPACGGVTYRSDVLLAGLTEHRCGACGLRIGDYTPLGPVTREFERVDAGRYLRAVGTARRRQARPIIDLLRAHAPPGASVLDVGCSFGFFLAEAREAGFKIRGIEPDEQAWQHATALLGDGVVEHGWFTGGEAGSADVVVTLDVLEHIPVPDQATFAAAVRKALTPDGRWVIKVPSTEGTYYRLSRLAPKVLPAAGETLLRRMWQTEYEYPHTVYFDRRSLARWLDRHGFDVLAAGYLPEVPPGTVSDRLSTDGAIGRGTARVLAPAVYAVTALDVLRRRSDALVMIARPR